MSGPRVSLVTVTRNRPETMERCVRSLASTGYKSVEWIILDNSDEPERRRLESLLGSLEASIELRLLHSEPIGFAALRQRACGAAEGEILISIDDDCIAPQGMIEAVVRRFEQEPRLGLLGGELINVGFEGAERFKGRGRLGVNGRYEPVVDSSQADVFGSANQSIRRAAFERAGGYDPFFSDGMEEADLTVRIRQAGYRVGYAPEIRIEHHHHPSRHAVRGRNLHKMRLYLYLKHWPPGGLGGWVGFLSREALLYGRDLMHQLRAWPRRLRNDGRPFFRRLLAATAGTFFDLLGATSARLSIPALYRRSRRRAAAERS